MSDVTDHDLICEYARSGSEEAFGELAHRHVDLVHSTAFRVLRNASLAEEVTQRVFVALARNATKLQHRAVLTGWLHETTRNFAITTVRSEERRRLREQEAATLETPESNDTQAVWDQIAPHLDDALAHLSEADRDAILLRYFERKTAREIGDRLGLTEEAAQKRAARALDRLRMIFAERGLSASANGLAGFLSIQAVQSAPVGLTGSVIAAAGTAGAVLPVTSTLGFIMASTKIKIGLAAVLVAGVSTPLVIQHQKNARLLDEVAALRRQSAELERLREENQRLAALNVDAAEPERQEHLELMRLRGQVGMLRDELRQVKLANPTSPESSPAISQSQTNPPASSLMQPGVALKDLGAATPDAAAQSFLWAMLSDEVGRLSELWNADTPGDPDGVERDKILGETAIELKRLLARDNTQFGHLMGVDTVETEYLARARFNALLNGEPQVFVVDLVRMDGQWLVGGMNFGRPGSPEPPLRSKISLTGGFLQDLARVR